MVNRLINVAFAFDIFLFTLLTLGGSYPYESFSSAAYRAETKGLVYGKIRPYIDNLFMFFFNQEEHCKKAYMYSKYNLPEDMR